MSSLKCAPVGGANTEKWGMGDSLKCGPACMGGEKCSNSRIYISNLPKNVTTDEIVEHFKGIGVVARERPRGRGVFPDQMPYRVKLYGNDDALLQYEDPFAAHAAPDFFDGQDLKGSKLKVELAEKKPNQGLDAPDPREAFSRGGGGGRGGGAPPGGHYGGGGTQGRYGGGRGGGPANTGDNRRFNETSGRYGSSGGGSGGSDSYRRRDDDRGSDSYRRRDDRDNRRDDRDDDRARDRRGGGYSDGRRGDDRYDNRRPRDDRRRDRSRSRDRR